jgi:hypothetical protein
MTSLSIRIPPQHRVGGSLVGPPPVRSRRDHQSVGRSDWRQEPGATHASAARNEGGPSMKLTMAIPVFVVIDAVGIVLLCHALGLI